MKITRKMEVLELEDSTLPEKAWISVIYSVPSLEEEVDLGEVPEAPEDPMDSPSISVVHPVAGDLPLEDLNPLVDPIWAADMGEDPKDVHRICMVDTINTNLHSRDRSRRNRRKCLWI